MRWRIRSAFGEADVVATFALPNAVLVADEQQDAGRIRLGERRRIDAEIGRGAAAFGEQHAAVGGKSDIGNGGRLRLPLAFDRGYQRRNDEFPTHVGQVEPAVSVEKDRPDAGCRVVARGVPAVAAKRRAAPDRVVEADRVGNRIAIDAETEDAAAEVGIVPAVGRFFEPGRRTRRIGAVVEPRRGLLAVGNDVEDQILAGGDVEEIGAAVEAVVEGLQRLAAIERDPVYQAGLQVGHEQLLIPRVEGDAAEARAFVLRAVVAEKVGERNGAVVVGRVQFPDRAGAAAGTPHPFGPALARRTAIESEDGCRRHVGIGRLGVVIGDAEDLAGFARGQREHHGWRGPYRAVGRKSGIAHRVGANGRAVRIGKRLAGRPGREARELRNDRIAGRQDTVLRAGRRQRTENDTSAGREERACDKDAE